jgi:hypothetical protein
MRTMTIFTGMKAVAVTAAISLLVLTATDAAPDMPALPAAQEPGPKNGSTLTLEVVDGANFAPLAGATVWVRVQGRRSLTREGRTDEEGRYQIVSGGATTGRFEVVVAAAGYVPSHLSSVLGMTSVRARLERAEAIGGVVRDEQGRPIEGARVFPMASPFATVWPEMYTSPNGGLAIATTDAQGLWRAEALPVGTDPMKFSVLVTHGDHITGEFSTAAREACASASVQVMKSGVSISGTVLNPFGRPVWDATVLVAKPPWDGALVRLVTDKDGHFRSSSCIDPARPGLVLLVQASGLAWAVHHVVVKPEITPQVIRLSRRRPLEGRVVDIQGQPLAGAVISCDREAFGGLLDWEAEADVDGRFVWYDAPTAGKFYLDVFKPPYSSTKEVIVRPWAGEVTISMRRFR